MRLFPRSLGRMALAATLLALVGLVLYPLARVASGVSLSTLTDPVILGIARATLAQSLASAALSALIGLPLGLWVWRSRAAQAFLAVPFGVPTVVAATAWVAWLGRSGVLARAGVGVDIAYSFKAVVLAHVAYNAPWIALLVAQARARVPGRLGEAATLLGARATDVFRYVLWPEVRWAFAAACAQVIAVCAMSFALVLILGGGPPVQTLEVALYSSVRGGTPDFEAASALALWELAITMLPWLAVLALRRRARETKAAATRALPGGSRAMAVVCALFVLPYFIVLAPEIAASLFASDFWIDAYPALLVSLKLALASAAGGFALALAGLGALTHLPRESWGRAALAWVLAVPAGVSLLSLGIGFYFAYGAFIDPFDGSFAAIVALQAVSLLPIALRALWPVAQSAARSELEAAVLLGARPARAFAVVEWPRWRRPLATTLALLVGVALGEVSAVSLFYSENLVPLPLLAARWMGQYRFEGAQALSALLFLLSLASILGVQMLDRTESRA